MKRRDFLLAPPYFGIAAGLTLAPVATTAVPFAVPFVFRLLLGGVIRGTVVRTVTTTATRQMVATATLGLRASGLLAVTTGVALAYEKYKASEIWVEGSAQQNLTAKSEPTSSTLREQVFVNYRVTDLETGKVEAFGTPRNVAVEANKLLSIPMLVTNLPRTGPKLVEGLATFDSAGNRPNPRFEFSQRKVVIVTTAAEVQTS